MKLTLLITLFALVMLLLAGCISNATLGPQKSGNSSNGGSLASTDKIVNITITAKYWEFNPNVISVKKGDRVRLTLLSTEGTHGFYLPEYNIDEKMSAGDAPVIVEFVADKTGEFEFRCSVPCGPGHQDQIGKLIVQP